MVVWDKKKRIDLYRIWGEVFRYSSESLQDKIGVGDKIDPIPNSPNSINHQ